MAEKISDELQPSHYCRQQNISAVKKAVPERHRKRRVGKKRGEEEEGGSWALDFCGSEECFENSSRNLHSQTIESFVSVHIFRHRVISLFFIFASF